MILTVYLTIFTLITIFQFIMLDKRCDWQFAVDFRKTLGSVSKSSVYILVGITSTLFSGIVFLVLAFLLSYFKQVIVLALFILSLFAFLWLTKRLSTGIVSLTNKRNSKGE